MSIFKRRINYKPFEYPEVMTFIEAINKSFWVHSEVDFTADIQDFKTNLTKKEQNAVKNALLGISQIEVGVKTFWGDLYKHLPKPEFNNLGMTLAENEVRHAEAYSQLLEVLGFNEEFEKLLEVPIIAFKLGMIEGTLMRDKEDIIKKLIFFTVVIENVSLFSLFSTILSLTRFKGYMKNVSNIIAWTSVDEQIHANAGIYLINEIKKELSIEQIEKLELELKEDIKMYLSVESGMIDWIFELGELDNFTKEDMLNFMKYRVDEALEKLGFTKMYNITSEEYKPMKWFEEEVFANELDDFFSKRPTAYTKHDKSITSNDLF